MPAVAELLLMAGGVFALGVGLTVFTGGAAPVSSFWLANGFALGMLLAAPRERWVALLVAAGLAFLAAGFYAHDDPRVSLLHAALNMVEAGLAAWSMPGGVATAAALTGRGTFLRFVAGAVLLAPAVMVGGLALGSHLTGMTLDLQDAQRVLVGHALGTAVMTPVTLALRSRELRSYFTPQLLPEVLLTLAVLAGITGLVFFQSSLPLLFLLFPPMMRIAYRAGFAGTAVAILIVTAIGVAAVSQGRGPIVAIQSAVDPASFPVLSDGLLVLQVFTASLLLSLFPLVVALEEGRNAHRASDELRNRLRLLMEHTTDVILLTDLDGLRMYVSPAVNEVLGFEAAHFLRLRWWDYVHELDQATVGAQIEEAKQTLESRTLVFRTVHGSGRTIWIEACMRHFRDQAFVLMPSERDSGMARNCGPNGDEGFVVTLRDITARRRAELELENANRELASLIRMDALTGLANRRRFDETLQMAWNRALAGGWPIAILMIDVDHFKQFNDSYGHPRGDQCLREVAAAITTGLFHPDDLAARYGGEEFTVILQNTSTDNAARVAERIRRAVHDLGRPHVASPLGVVTVSVGVASAFPVERGDPLAVVRAADQALYTSKHEGRNRTTLLDVTWPG